MREVHLWVREDGGQPKVVPAGAEPPGPGRVVAVQARSADEARMVLSVAQQSLPDLPEGLPWQEVAEISARRSEIQIARVRVREVNRA